MNAVATTSKGEGREALSTNFFLVKTDKEKRKYHNPNCICFIDPRKAYDDV